MAQENVERLRVAIEAWNSGTDRTPIFDLFAGDSVIHPFPEWPGRPVYYGREGWREVVEEWLETFDEISWDIDQLIDDDEQVIALVNHRGRIKGTGTPVALPMGAVFSDFREDGSFGAGRFFASWEEALESAGLR